MFDIGLPEFLVLGVLALIVFGPDRLPEIAAKSARAIKALRIKANEATAELTESLDLPDLSDIAGKVRSATPAGMMANGLSGMLNSKKQNGEADANVGPRSANAVRVDGEQVTFDPDAT